MLAKAQADKSEIKIIVAGNGEFNHFSGETIRTKKIAQQEGKLALQKLNIPNQNLICLDFPEKSIPYNVAIVEKIDKIISAFKPDLILTHWINDTHQDHINVSKSVLSAARYHNSILMWEPIFPSGRTAISSFSPQIYIDISKFQEQKIKALQCHQSQIKKFSNRKIDWINGITARAKYRGFEINSKYAETFQVVRLQIDF